MIKNTFLKHFYMVCLPKIKENCTLRDDSGLSSEEIMTNQRQTCFQSSPRVVRVHQHTCRSLKLREIKNKTKINKR